VFAGIAVDGSVLRIDDDANEAYYGKKDVSAADIVDGKVRSNDESARRFLAAVGTSTGAKTASNTTTASAPTPPPPSNVQSDAPAPLRSSPAPGATSFPMEDPNPGREPR